MNDYAWIKSGFNPIDIIDLSFESLTAGEWTRFDTKPPRVKNSGLPGLPQKPFLYPFRNETQEFTIIIPVDFDSEAIAYLNNNTSVIPGVYFANIGESWQIFFNGNLVRSEMYKIDRSWRHVYFPIDRSFFTEGINILALRIIGDPGYNATGLAFSAPHYIDDYKVIERRLQNFLFNLLCCIIGFTGICYLLIFIFIRKKIDVYYLWFSIYSILLCVYAFSVNEPDVLEDS